MSSLANRATLHLKYALQRTTRRVTRRDQPYHIEGVDVVLPPEHRLSYYQAVFPRYDRYFLPILTALAADRPTLLVDIGANVGDTAIAAIRASDNIEVVAVEGNPYFLGYLRRNVAPFGSRVRVVDRFVGPLDQAVTYAHNGSTGGFVRSEGTAADGPAAGATPDWVAASSLVDDPSRLVVWKSDTDGFDIHLAVNNWDVLHKHCGVLWLEYDPNMTSGNPADVAELGRLLGESGRTVWFFDNVGTHMATARGHQAQALLASLTAWLLRQRNGEIAVPYLDIWALDDASVAVSPDPATLP